MGSMRRPSRPVVKKRRTVAAAFASAVRDLQASGVTARRAIADELNRRGVPTERNGRWHYTTVVRMLVRLGMVDQAASQPEPARRAGGRHSCGPGPWRRSSGNCKRRGSSRQKPLR
jgi:hypothetical protein